MKIMINKTFNHLTTFLNSKKCIVKWSSGEFTSKNIGDVLNVYLFKEIFNKEIVSYKDVLNIGVPPVYSFIGSVLDNSAVKNLTVLGSGFKRENSKIIIKPKKVIACRGPLTRSKFLDIGVDTPKVYGDPSILLPLYFNPEVDKKYKMGIIPHYVDKDLEQVKRFSTNPEVIMIDVFSEMEEFISNIKTCEFTISSSLHGVILSHVFGIPSVWVKLSDTLSGGDFKFQDYSQSFNFNMKPLILDGRENLSIIQGKTFLPDLTSLADNLSQEFKNIKI